MRKTSMGAKEFKVDLVCHQRSVYLVRADDAAAAKRLALDRWQRVEPSDVAGFDSAEIQAVQVEEAADTLRQAQDDELILRFIREREKLLNRLGSEVSGTTPSNDAISAAQAARDLGWYGPEGVDVPVPDTIRAALALERLCTQRHLVCFERRRARQNERGEVRLYCTPEYLEHLTATIEGTAPATP
jgi:hypothetical protein